MNSICKMLCLLFVVMLFIADTESYASNNSNGKIGLDVKLLRSYIDKYPDDKLLNHLMIVTSKFTGIPQRKLKRDMEVRSTVKLVGNFIYIYTQRNHFSNYSVEYAISITDGEPYILYTDNFKLRFFARRQIPAEYRGDYEEFFSKLSDEASIADLKQSGEYEKLKNYHLVH